VVGSLRSIRNGRPHRRTGAHGHHAAAVPADRGTRPPPSRPPPHGHAAL